MRKKRAKPPSLSPLENACMQVIWKAGSASAEQVRKALAAKHDLKDSTVRTVLRRLEAKDVLTHTVEGRTYLYEPKREAGNVAGDAVQQIADRFCKGSLPSLLLGMASDARITADELRELADKIDKADLSEEAKRSDSKKRRK
ncbi:MAG: BlaI/MecI/CopY family transcriptional regulator [Planctomycetota bacterium]